MRLPLLSIAVLSLALAPAVRAESVPQTPKAVTVDYAVADDGALYLMFKAGPPVNGCGHITEWPIKTMADYESIDIHLGEYEFVHPDGPVDKKKCGSTYKTASAEIALNAVELGEIKRLRLWYGDKLDTLVLQPGGAPRDLTLGPVGTPKLFTLGKKLGEMPQQAPAPETTDTAAVPDLTNIVLLSTGEDAADQILRVQIRDMAVTRGFEPTADPDLFFDKTGQYYKRLATEQAIEVGAVMVEGNRIPIYGIRLDQRQKK